MNPTCGDRTGSGNINMRHGRRATTMGGWLWELQRPDRQEPPPVPGTTSTPSSMSLLSPTAAAALRGRAAATTPVEMVELEVGEASDATSSCSWTWLRSTPVWSQAHVHWDALLLVEPNTETVMWGHSQLVRGLARAGAPGPSPFSRVTVSPVSPVSLSIPPPCTCYFPMCPTYVWV